MLFWLITEIFKPKIRYSLTKADGRSNLELRKHWFVLGFNILTLKLAEAPIPVAMSSFMETDGVFDINRSVSLWIFQETEAIRMLYLGQV